MGPILVVWGTAGTGASILQTISGFLLTIFGVGTVAIAISLARFTYKSLRLAFFLSILFAVGNFIMLMVNILNLLSGKNVDSPNQAIFQPTIFIVIALITILFIKQNLGKFTSLNY